MVDTITGGLLGVGISEASLNPVLRCVVALTIL